MTDDLNDDGSHWTDQAACRKSNPETYFPAKDDTHTIRTAKLTCSQCPVQAQCLTHALSFGEYHGIWGGYTTSERETIRKAQRLPKIRPPESRFWFPHGTPAGYRRHHRAGETPCLSCQRAEKYAKSMKRERDRERRQALKEEPL